MLNPWTFGWLLAAALALYALHRLASWLEERGWIYYRKKHGRGALGHMFLEWSSIYDPGIKQVIERRAGQQDEKEEGESGDSPEGGERG